MTGARARHTHHERSIAKQLGLTDAQLDALLKIKRGYWPGNAAACLEDKGLAFRHRDERNYCTGEQGLTVAGERTLAQARALGF